MSYTKEKEIAALKALVEMDGYFADTFGDDFEDMALNIANGNYILFNTRWSKLFDRIEELFRNMQLSVSKFWLLLL